MISEGTLKLVRYPPEKLVDAVALAALPSGAGVAPVPLYLTGIKDDGWLVRLEDVATVQLAGLQLQLNADTARYPWDNGLANLGSGVAGLPDRWRVTATQNLSLNVVNAGPTALSNVLASWGLWVWRPSLADRMRWLGESGAGDPLAQLLPQGYLPQRTLSGLIEVLYLDQAQVAVFEGVVSVGTQPGVPVPQQLAGLCNTHPPAGYFDVLIEVDVDASVGGTIPIGTQISNGVTVNVTRDASVNTGGVSIVSYPAAGVPYNPSVGATADASRVNGTRPVVVARSNLQVYLTAQATVSNVPFRLVVLRCKEYEEHRALWGLPGASQAVRDRVLAGVF